ncbi:MAG TPA: hypothetical protein VFG83_11615 [Kofleriaceae bacterium]|nr:hypothetical protein [Kofleriaceae bacterium]
MPLQSILAKKLARLFPDPARRAEAEAILASYPDDSASMDPPRVRLAVLKLGGSDLDRLRENMAAAHRDPRDVIAWAEYPEAMREQTWRMPPGSTELREIAARDQRQYEAWLNDPAD